MSTGPDRATHRIAVARFWAGILAMAAVTGAVALATIALLPAAASPWSATVVGSGSMAPALRTGDVVVLEPPGDEPLGPPTVVLVDRPGSEPHLLHRVVDFQRGVGYTTQGDANDSPDSEPVPRDSVLGTGRLLVPYVGWPAWWVATGAVPELVVFLIAAVLLVRLAHYGWDAKSDPWSRPVPPPSGKHRGDTVELPGAILPPVPSIHRAPSSVWPPGTARGADGDPLIAGRRG